MYQNLNNYDDIQTQLDVLSSQQSSQQDWNLKYMKCLDEEVEELAKSIHNFSFWLTLTLVINIFLLIALFVLWVNNIL